MKFEDLTPEQRARFQARRQKCEVWTRVMGYHRPTCMFNAGKVSEFKERKMFTEAKAVTHMKDA